MRHVSAVLMGGIAISVGASTPTPESIEASIGQAEERLEQLEQEAARAAQELQESERVIDSTVQRREISADRVEVMDARLRLLRMRASMRANRLEELRTRQVSLIVPVALGDVAPGDPLAAALAAVAARHTPHIALVADDLEALESEIDMLRDLRERRYGALVATDTSLAIHRTARERLEDEHGEIQGEAQLERATITTLFEQLESLAPSVIIPGASLAEQMLQVALPPPAPMPSTPASPEAPPPDAPPLDDSPPEPQIPWDL